MDVQEDKPPSQRIVKEQAYNCDPNNMVDEFTPFMVFWYLGRQGGNGIGRIALSGIHPSGVNRHTDLLDAYI